MLSKACTDGLFFVNSLILCCDVPIKLHGSKHTPKSGDKLLTGLSIARLKSNYSFTDDFKTLFNIVYMPERMFELS